MFFLLALGSAIACFYFYSSRTDEISRLITACLALFCLLFSLIYAPWFIKIAVVIAIALLFPNYRRNVL